MILDKLENTNLYEGIHVGINKAFNYIRNTNFSDLPNGKHDIEGDAVFAIVKEYETKNLDNNLLEAHLKYIDIHYIAEGTEKIGVATLTNQKAKKVYDIVEDYTLFEEPYDLITLNKDMFAVFFPDDLHLPEIKSDNLSRVRKVVIKVKI